MASAALLPESTTASQSEHDIAANALFFLHTSPMISAMRPPGEGNAAREGQQSSGWSLPGPAISAGVPVHPNSGRNLSSFDSNRTASPPPFEKERKRSDLAHNTHAPESPSHPRNMTAANTLCFFMEQARAGNMGSQRENTYDPMDTTVEMETGSQPLHHRPRAASLMSLASEASELDSSFSDFDGMRSPPLSSSYIGSYSPAARRRVIERFLEKRKHRVWRKRIKYDVRKSFADSRIRVKGRFVRKEDEEQLRELLMMCA